MRCGEIVKRASKQAGRISVPADPRLVPLNRLRSEMRRDQTVAVEAFMNVVLGQNGAAEILEHRKAALVSQRISADVMAVCRKNSKTDGVVAKQAFARSDNRRFRALGVAVKNIKLRDSVLLQERCNRDLRYPYFPGGLGRKTHGTKRLRANTALHERDFAVIHHEVREVRLAVV